MTETNTKTKHSPGARILRRGIGIATSCPADPAEAAQRKHDVVI
jgi:hypothetical protein